MKIITKATSRVDQLPMNVIGMVAHGLGDGAYTHYMPINWPSDSNAIIASLIRVFRRIPRPPPPLQDTRAIFLFVSKSFVRGNVAGKT